MCIAVTWTSFAVSRVAITSSLSLRHAKTFTQQFLWLPAQKTSTAFPNVSSYREYLRSFPNTPKRDTGREDRGLDGAVQTGEECQRS